MLRKYIQLNYILFGEGGFGFFWGGVVCFLKKNRAVLIWISWLWISSVHLQYVLNQLITFYFTSLFVLSLPRCLCHTFFFFCLPISKTLTPKFTLTQWQSFILLWQNLSIRREPPKTSNTIYTHLSPPSPICTHIICLPTWHHRYKVTIHLPNPIPPFILWSLPLLIFLFFFF